MIKPATKHLDCAPEFAAVPGCFRDLEAPAWEALRPAPPPTPRRPARVGRASLAALAVLLLMPLSGAFGAMATLKVQNAAASADGRSLTVPVVFSAPAGCAVAALQFDVEFDPAVLTLSPSGGVLEGAAAKAAGKQISFSKVSPDKMRVLVVGLNADTIAGGEVAKLNFSVSGGTAFAASAVHVRNAVLADPNGSEVPVQPGGGEVQNGPISPPDGAPGAPHTLWAAASVLLLGCLAAGCAAAGFAWRRHARGKDNSRNSRKKAAARCAAARHG